MEIDMLALNIFLFIFIIGFAISPSQAEIIYALHSQIIFSLTNTIV